MGDSAVSQSHAVNVSVRESMGQPFIRSVRKMVRRQPVGYCTCSRQPLQWKDMGHRWMDGWMDG